MKLFSTFGGLLVALFFSSSLMAQTQDIPFEDLPPTNEFGKCYAKCKTADVYETITQSVLVKEERTVLSKVPAVYESGSERIMVKEGTTNYKVIPAKYRTETRSVLVSEARGQWVKKKKDPNCFSDNPEDCYIACYEEVPAKYRNEKYQVLDQPATTREDVIPAKYQTVTRRVIDEPARVIEVPVEPQYKTIKTKVLVSSESVTSETIPAVLGIQKTLWLSIFLLIAFLFVINFNNS